MKKFLGVLLAFLMVLGGCSANDTKNVEEANTSKLKPGKYTATAMGFHDELTVEVEVSEDSILNVNVVDHKETRFIADNAINQLPKDIVDSQSIKVDTYTGCTVSSLAVISATKDALSQAGDISLFEKEAEKVAVEDKVIDTDVLVIGGGMAGLSAALSAKENGSNVVLLEKLDRVGGSTVLAGGFLYATGSSVNKELDNDVNALVDYWQQRAEGNADEKMLQIAAEGSATSVEKLKEWGVLFSTTVVPTGTSPALRGLYASNADAQGAPSDAVDFIVPLLNKANEVGVEIYTGVSANELLVDDNNVVVGAKATSKTANYTINAKSVVIASGGFDLNSEMMEKYSPEMAGTWAISSPGNTGDGITMAEAVGADTNFTGGVIGFKIIDVTKHYIEGSNFLAWSGLLGVTNLGNRFGNESADYPIFCTSLINAKKEGAEKFYLVLDSANADQVSLAEEAVAKNLGFKAETIEDLANNANINLDNFKATVENYNEIAKGNGTDEFGKTGFAAVETGPFYAVEVKPATLGTIGGLLISENAEVLDETGNPIKGLYAAGEVANSQFLYKEYPASGTSISITTTFGIIAGKQASENSK